MHRIGALLKAPGRGHRKTFRLLLLLLLFRGGEHHSAVAPWALTRFRRFSFVAAAGGVSDNSARFSSHHRNFIVAFHYFHLSHTRTQTGRPTALRVATENSAVDGAHSASFLVVTWPQSYQTTAADTIVSLLLFRYSALIADGASDTDVTQSPVGNVCRKSGNSF